MSKEPKQVERVLAILEDAKGGWVDGMVFLNLFSPILQYHARIFELQAAHHNIEADWVPGKNWKRYRLIPPGQLFHVEPATEKPKPFRMDP